MDALKEGLLKLDPGLLLWTIITFIVLVLILWKAAWKPIVNSLDSRAEKLRGDIEKAEKARLEAEAVLNKNKEILDNAKDETAKIIAEGKVNAEKIRSEIIAKAGQEAGDITERAKREINTAKERALGELKLEIVNIATDIASKIIVKNLKPEDQEAIVKDALSKVDSIQ
ncbi:MAG: F0F1 ATP synthase subunit B [Spirochaetes bacterium]|nr:F0F1 ATP synthase subunit B [Spirochaetota bacterium]